MSGAGASPNPNRGGRPRANTASGNNSRPSGPYPVNPMDGVLDPRNISTQQPSRSPQPQRQPRPNQPQDGVLVPRAQQHGGSGNPGGGGGSRPNSQGGKKVVIVPTSKAPGQGHGQGQEHPKQRRSSSAQMHSPNVINPRKPAQQNNPQRNPVPG
ncbi:hypothetical protein SARC_16163, partial [Sphaeroforma arctica JP610]